MNELLYKALLAKPVGKVARSNDTHETTPAIPAMEREVPVEGTQEDALRQAVIDEGLDPDQWRVTGMRTSRWETHDGEERVSRKLTLERIHGGQYDQEAIEGFVSESVMDYSDSARKRPNPSDGTLGYCIFLGDLQVGKGDGDGPEGTFKATIRCLDAAYERISILTALGYGIGHIHIGWMGDHVEGFTSQNGANSWRTVLTMNEQVRFMRRLMMHALSLFAPLAAKVTMAAVPGNHGEPQRFEGKGITRYDDSHDTESLIAVSDFAREIPERFGHVEFYVPDTDEMTVLVNVAGLNILHNHGHNHRPNKHFDWWRGQAFHSPNASAAGMLVEGHLHHDHIERDGSRLWVGVGALEMDSAWYRHQTGSPGWPSITGVLIRDGEPVSIDLIYGGE